MSRNILGPLGIEWMELRGISVETAVKFGIYTASSQHGGVIADPVGNVLVFPYERRGAVVGEKYRAPPKKFWQRAGGRRTFWNADALDDPALESGYLPLVITEGEFDALTAIDCGFPLTVSVPDGAPAVQDGEDPDALAPLQAEAETTGKFEFLWHNRDRLKLIKRFVLAVDADAPGRRLAAELVRRLSPSRCSFVTYPAGCKDLNEVRIHLGPEAVAAVLNTAQPYPVRGLYRLSEFPVMETAQAYCTGWDTLDRCLKVFPGEFMVVTGIPGHGKSTWVLNLLGNLADMYGWRAAIFSPEMPAVPYLRDKLRKIKSGSWAGGFDPSVDAWIEDRFVFIDADPTGRTDEDFDLDWVIDRATDAVLRDGVQVLVIDPWNEIEHARRRDESGTDYIARGIRALKRFARLYSVAVIVVAHPTKEVGKDGKSRPVSLYDIEGSAHWFNKCDHGVVIDRPNAETNDMTIRVAKVRFDDTGEKGTVRMSFNRDRSRYEMLHQPAGASE